MSTYPAQYYGSATPIVNQTNVGVNTLSAQITSGGGGGGGANPSFSTITLNPGLGIGGVLFTSSLVFQDTNSLLQGTDIFVMNNDANQPITNNPSSEIYIRRTDWSSRLGFDDTGRAYYRLLNGSNLSTGTLDFGKTQIDMTSTNLNVSSINGAPPGGGGGPNPIVSSITFPNGQFTSNSGINFNTILAFNDISSINQTDFYMIANQPEPYLNTSTNAIQINAPSGVGAIMSLEAGNNSTAMILVQDTTNALQPLEVVASALNTSTINVNAINNQKAPQNVQFSSISLSGNLADAFAVDGTQNWFQSVGGMGILNVIMPISSLLGGSAPVFKLNNVEPPIPGVFIPTSVDVKTNSIAGNYSISNWEYINGDAITWSGFTSTGTISTIAINITGYSQIF